MTATVPLLPVFRRRDPLATGSTAPGPGGTRLPSSSLSTTVTAAFKLALSHDALRPPVTLRLRRVTHAMIEQLGDTTTLPQMRCRVTVTKNEH